MKSSGFSRWMSHGAVVAALMIVAMPALAGSCSSEKASAQQASIVDTAVEAGSFNTLVAAAQAAGLAGALGGEGPLTVFAPTDEAFAKLPKGTVETLLKPENKDLLVSILTYHVAPGLLTADKVVAMERIETLNGQRPAIAMAHGKVMIGEATITATDVMAANGVIHVIDTVLIPADKDIVATAVDAGGFNTLAAALTAANLVGALQGKGPFTVFAPTDEAFAKLPKGTVETLLKPENKDQLTAILTYHVVAGSVYSSDVRPGRVETLQGSEITISQSSGNLMIDQATVVATDVVASNGVIHVIDQVILPPSLRSSASDSAEQLIRLAIDRGAPLYNHDMPQACAAIYEVTANALLSSSDMGLSEHHKATIAEALDRMHETGDSRRQAWIMRHAFDDVMESMAKMRTVEAVAMDLR